MGFYKPVDDWTPPSSPPILDGLSSFSAFSEDEERANRRWVCRNPLKVVVFGKRRIEGARPRRSSPCQEGFLFSKNEEFRDNR